MPIDPQIHFGYLLWLADSNLVLGHRLSEWIGRAPVIEEELALANIALDLIVENKNRDFAHTIVRQFLYSAFAELYWDALTASRDAELAAIAVKAVKECAYHVRHSAEWLIRFGDGTQESHGRAQKAVDELWMYTGEMFESDEIDRAVRDAGIGVIATDLKPAWNKTVEPVLIRATLQRPKDGWMMSGGRTGRHTEHLGHMLAEMQFLQRAYPGQQW
jgi:ring-1,2-phenylacetyl-CoA epoxidase subunit PaaC